MLGIHFVYYVACLCLVQSAHNLQNALNVRLRSILELTVYYFGHRFRSTGSTQNLVLQ